MATTPRESVRATVGENKVTRSSKDTPFQVATVAALRALSVTNLFDGQKMHLACYATIGDGGEGDLYYSASSVAADDGGITFAPTSGSGRFIRQVVGLPVNVRWYGAKGDGSTDDTTAIQSAINALTSGGSVFVPRGNYVISQISVPQFVRIFGVGSRASKFTGTASATDYLILCGSDASLRYGIAIEDVGVFLNNIAQKGIKLTSTAGAYLSNIYIEGLVSAGKSDIGVCITGSASSGNQFTTLININCNHLKTGYKILSSAAVPTAIYSFGCNSFGDVTVFAANGSIGIDIDADCGQGSTFVGGNIESCQTGINLRQSAERISVYGTRFEANTTDIVLGVFTTGSSFIGLQNLNTVTNSGGTGFGQHSFVGCSNESGVVVTNEFYTSKFIGKSAADIPLTVSLYPLATGNGYEIKDSSGTVIFAIDCNGFIVKQSGYGMKILNGTGTPEGAVTAEIGSLYSDRSGGAATTLYVKTSGSGNTGWTAK